tara:strand:+ start:246 stop:743 length:498 start_codon:yes stop_codon:yes gene_type:complete
MIIKNLRKNFFINLSLVLLIFLLDRFSKIYVIYLDKKFLGSEIFSSKFLNITLIWNEGIAFGLLSFDRIYFYNILTLIIGIVILVLIIMAINSNGLKRYSLSVIIGGAIGNLLDRIVFSAVPDFIDFHIGNFHWFIFNVSDIFITLGIISLIIIELLEINENKEI